MFGAGTAAVISPISTFGHRGSEFMIYPTLEASYASLLKEKNYTIYKYNKNMKIRFWVAPLRFKILCHRKIDY